MMTMKPKPLSAMTQGFIALAVGALAIGMRLPMLRVVLPDGTQPKTLWYDEAYSAFIADRGVAEAFRISGADTTPALFNVLLSAWTSVFGDGVYALVALPFALSLLGVWLTWRLGREAGGDRVGLVASAVVAVAPLHVAYATEVRTYSLLYCLSAAAFLFLLRHLRTDDRRDLAAWTAASLAGFYASYTYLLVFLPQAAILAWRAGKRAAAWRRLAAAAGALVLGYLPQVLIYRRWSDFFPVDGQPSSYFSRAFTHGGADAILTYFATLGFGQGAYYPISQLGSLLAAMGGAAVLAALAWSAWAGRSRAATALAVGAFGAAAAAMVVGFVFAPRYYVAALAPAAALAGIGVVRASRPAFAGVLLALVLLPFGLNANRPPDADAFKYYAPRFSGVIARNADPGDLVLVDHFTDILFRRYPPGSAEVALFFPKRGENVTDVAERFRWVDYDFMSEEDYATLERLTAGRSHVWTIDYVPQHTAIQDPRGLRRAWFEKNFRMVAEEVFPRAGSPYAQRAVLTLYERK